jgi:hypothetical protein
MKRMTIGLILTAVLTASSMVETTALAETELLADGKDAKSERIENMRHVRYIELFFSTHDTKTEKLVAPCYNTTFRSSGIPESRDTAPQALVKDLDFDKLANEYEVLHVLLNGPKRWMLDWFEVDVGKERIFQGLQAPWVAQLNLRKADSLGAGEPYKPLTIARKSSCGWNKGNKVVLIDDAEGNTWVMKGFEEGLEPQHTYEEFLTKGASLFKKLPPGWKVRVKTLEKDLIETPENGVAAVMPDEFFNVYDRTGPGMTNYKP